MHIEYHNFFIMLSHFKYRAALLLLIRNCSQQNWKKFGNSEFDAPGPNVATTTVSDDVFMTFISNKEVWQLWYDCDHVRVQAPTVFQSLSVSLHFSEAEVIKWTLLQDLNAQDQEEDPMNKLKGQKIVSCRICKGDHWTTRCPYKDTLGPMQKELAEQLGLSTGEKEKAAGVMKDTLT